MRHQEEILCCGDGKVLEQVTQRSWEFPIPGSVQGQSGWGFETPGLVKCVPTHGREIGIR